VKVSVEDNKDKKIFRRLYVCLKACKDSFVSCRPIIGLDGCFLKGKYGGELLTAVARDANDQMLPLAYFVVEVENKETWAWFLELLVYDLGGPELCARITFMSDQQKVSYLVSILFYIFTFIYFLCSLIMTILSIGSIASITRFTTWGWAAFLCAPHICQFS